ncbi:MAG: tetratricopeptide repeat protein [Candidatus Hydrogenedentes bacterium]|nr:tetratricopeptide repeat protein [Candidatus Hydrogenedentota bacterium]
MRHLGATLALVLLTAFVFAPVRSFDFVNLDDDVYLTDHARVQDGLTTENVAWAATTFFYANWHPLTWWSYLLDVELFGFSASVFHTTNAIIHLLTVLLVYAFFLQCGAGWGRALAVAACFAVHPLHVESVAWISQRKDVLCGFFWFLTCIAYLAYARSPGIVRYAGVAFALILALMSKPMAVTLPFVLLLLDVWPLSRLRTRDELDERLREKIPLFVLSAGCVALTLFAQVGSGSIQTLETFSPGTRIANGLVSYFTYLSKVFWPSNLAFFYPHPVDGIGAVQIAVAAIGVAVLTGFSILASRSRPYLFVGWFWFLGTLVPVIGALQVGTHAMADRYMYIPMMGLLICIVWAVTDWTTEIRWRQQAAGVAAAGTIILLAVTASAQTKTWRNAETLFRHALTVTSNNFLAHNNLGVALRDTNREEAIEQFEAALAILPDYREAHLNLGNVYLEEGRPEEAVAQFLEMLRSDPNDFVAHLQFGRARSMQQRYTEAIAHYEVALRADSSSAVAFSNIGNVMVRSGRTAEALDALRRALEVDPHLGGARFEVKRLEEIVEGQGI